MKTRKLFKVVAPVSVAFGLTLLCWLLYIAARDLGIINLHEVLFFMPTWIIKFVGVMNVLSFAPMFILGFIALKPEGAIGQSKQLLTTSVYKYIRNPMYAGISFSVMGIGLIIGKTHIAALGLLWLAICYAVSLIEERELKRRFGQEYVDYKKATPRFVPDFETMIRSILKRIKKFAFQETKN